MPIIKDLNAKIEEAECWIFNTGDISIQTNENLLKNNNLSHEENFNEIFDIKLSNIKL